MRVLCLHTVHMCTKPLLCLVMGFNFPRAFSSAPPPAHTKFSIYCHSIDHNANPNHTHLGLAALLPLCPPPRSPPVPPNLPQPQPYVLARLRDDYKRGHNKALHIAPLGFANLVEFLQWEVFAPYVEITNCQQKGERGCARCSVMLSTCVSVLLAVLFGWLMM